MDIDGDYTSWRSAVLAAERKGSRLPTTEEWKLIGKYLEDINRRIEDNGGTAVFQGKYWTSEEFDSGLAKIYDTHKRKISRYNKVMSTLVRTIRDI